MCAIRAAWQEITAIMQSGTGNINDDGPNLGATATVSSGSLIGVDTDKFGLECTNQPIIDPGMNFIEAKKTLGLAVPRVGTGYERQIGIRLPTTTLEFDVTAANLSFFLWMLLHSGVAEVGSGPDVYTGTAYTSPVCEGFCHVWRIMAATGAVSHKLSGAICTSLTLSGEEGGTVKGVAEMTGRSFVDNVDMDSNSATAIAYDGVAPILFQNLTIELNTTPIYCPAFSFTITNNAIAKMYDSQTVQRFILGNLDITGTFTLPWDSDSGAVEDGNQAIDDFIAGTPARFEAFTTANPAAADADIALDFGVVYDGAPIGTDDETATELSCRGAYDGTTPAISISAACTSPSRGIT